ncbi:uncharacterized protein LOC116203141 [Punica granatum]|uniref:Uncharacterized protein n=2 Tax=Punica granatum TaxID=22663 RepID=A0A2I0KN90_PUNGR|nr:uncharacterized protein LOC116203141 [Punica granatum]PKI69954.1 hypothetical protein CRG98_009829 [Punica granatum]
MGNYISCTLSTQTASGNLRSAAKVILPTGEVQQFFTPTNAAELMLETPNHFLVNSQSLRIGRKFSALNADEDLEMGNVYVMFPMNRLSSTITASDLGPLFLKASSSSKKAPSNIGSGAGRVRVSPESDEVPLRGPDRISSEAPKLSLEGIEEFSLPEFMHRMSMSRSKKPLLETIAEDDQIYSR